MKCLRMEKKKNILMKKLRRKIYTLHIGTNPNAHQMFGESDGAHAQETISEKIDLVDL